MIRLIVFLLVLFLVDFYAFQSFKTLLKTNWLPYIYIVVSLGILAFLFYSIYSLDRTTGFSTASYIAIALFVLTYVTKLTLAIVMFGEDIFRFFEGTYASLSSNASSGDGFFGSRRKFVSQIALGIAAIPFASILYGIYKGKYNFKVLNYTLHFEDLPEAFDGYKITQISDVHSGSFDNTEKIKYAIDLINEQQSDTILFTGDMVNNLANEMEPHIGTFKKLHARDGMYSILGNHDYGDYVSWPSQQDKIDNLERLKAIQKDIGFDLLLNESRFIEKDGQRIAIVGVENWGKGGFKKAGDLKKASANIESDDFKILLSHDPSHWDAEVVKDDYHYHLTLSGHTHGMQFGIEIPGWFKWSPVKWRYKQWAGIYEKMGQYINVNRGFGYLAFPGRVGIWPEITVIELKRGAKPS
ncbi:MAG: metallophosphoesterase [Bacteroidota bacterium]